MKKKTPMQTRKDGRHKDAFDEKNSRRHMDRTCIIVSLEKLSEKSSNINSDITQLDAEIQNANTSEELKTD